MRIARAECDNFMKFRDRAVPFSPGLNVVLGLNEAGKTTLQRFLKVMLYGCGPGQKAVREAVIPWGAEQAAGKLILELGTPRPRRLRVERTIRADRPTPPRIYDDVTNRDLTGELDAAGAFPANLIGLDAEAFERTVWVQQGALGAGSSATLPTIERIRNLATGGREENSLSRARDALSGAIEGLGTARSTTRPLDRVEARLRQASERLLQAQVDHRLLAAKEMELRDAHRRMAAAQADWTRLAAAGEALRYAQLKERAEKVRGLEAELAELESTRHRLRRYEAFPAHRQQEFESVGELLQAAAKSASGRLQRAEAALARLTEQRGLAAWRVARQQGELQGCKLPPADVPPLQQDADQKARQVQVVADQVALLERAVSSEHAGRTLRVWFLAAGLAAELAAAVLALFHWSGIVLVVVLPVLLYALYLAASSALPQRAASRQLAQVGRRLDELRDEWAVLLERAGTTEPDRLAAWSKAAMSLGQAQQSCELADRAARAAFGELQQLGRSLARIVEGLAGAPGPLRELARQLERLASMQDPAEPAATATGDAQPENLSAAVQQAEDRMGLALGEVAEIRDEMAMLAQRRHALLREASAASDEEFRDGAIGHAALSGIQRKIESDSQQLRDWSQGRSPAELAADLAEMEGQFPQEFGRSPTAVLEELAAGPPAERDLREVEHRLEAARTEVGSLQTRNAVLEMELQELDRRTEDVGLIEAEIAHWERRRAALERHRRLLGLALDALQEAQDRVQRTFLPRLNEEFNRIISSITGSSARRFNLDDLAQVQVTGEQTRSVEPLSFGTQEQVYLSLRLALVRVASGSGEPLPLLLDEPFASADSARLASALRLLAAWSDQTQVILFTCHDHIARAAQEAAGAIATRIDL